MKNKSYLIRIFKKGKMRALILGLAAIGLGFSRLGFSENQSGGFYAGPLSAVVEAIVEVAAEKPAVDENLKKLEEKNKKSDFKKVQEINADSKALNIKRESL